MQVHIFRETGAKPGQECSDGHITHVVERISGATDTNELVVAVYLQTKGAAWRGEYCKVGRILSPWDFVPRSGHFSMAKAFGTPDGLPDKYVLIRMLFGTGARYPKSCHDSYGWTLDVESFEEHLAYLFAHELHHYRRHHLGLHPREGEQSANKWALARLNEVGYAIVHSRTATRKRRPGRKTMRIPAGRNPELLRNLKLGASHLGFEDLSELHAWIASRRKGMAQHLEQESREPRHEALRGLPDGTALRIRSSRRDKDNGKIVKKVRTPRRDSRRMVVEFPDGSRYYYPMDWLEVAG
ncbi:MAG: hypothetical protein ISS72_03780 [Candidatus Brocadiae bacterium]|nr:hypothetical protein [Candidatus Brocadiia bacterium]